MGSFEDNQKEYKEYILRKKEDSDSSELINGFIVLIVMCLYAAFWIPIGIGVVIVLYKFIAWM